MEQDRLCIPPHFPPKDENKGFRAKWTYINKVQFYCPTFLSIQFSKHFCGGRETRVNIETNLKAFPFLVLQHQ